MRTSMSAIGSLILMQFSLPARLDYAGHFAAQREVAQFVAPQAKFAIDTARPAGERAAVAQPHRGGVARQLLQLGTRLFARLVRGALVVDDLEQLRALCLEFLDRLAALLVAELECEFGHAVPLQCLNGKRKRSEE